MNDQKALFHAGAGIKFGDNCALYVDESGDIVLERAGVIVAKFDASGTAQDTKMLLRDVDNGSVDRVSVGAADSGGLGFKVLRLPN